MVQIEIKEVDSTSEQVYLEIIYQFIEEVIPKEMQKESKEYYKVYMQKEEKIKTHKRYLGYKNGILIGCVEIFYYEHPPMLGSDSYFEGEVLNMFVKSGNRKKGYGKCLMNHVISEAQKLGLKRLVLNASPDGEKLYRNHGFKDMDFKEMSLRINL
jgi:N-acetylglutamate synthase-like GNAT family acetyltransferase